MDGRIRNLLRMVLPLHQHLGIRLLILVSTVCCFGLTAEAKSDYEIINTGIKGGGCWYDDNHFIVVKGEQPAPGQEFEVEGLYYLDPTRPKDLKRIDLSPLEPSVQRHIRDVTCQDQTVLFHLQSNQPGLRKLFGLKIGAKPELISEMRGGSVNFAGQYVVGKFRRPGLIEEQGLQGMGIYEAHPDCAVKYVKHGLKVLCLETWMESGWSTSNLRVVEYKWYETILVRDRNGQEKRVPNPEPPLKLADSTELKHGYLLRDLDNRLVQQIKLEQPPYEIYHRHLMKIDPQGGYLYASCSKAGDHGEKHYMAGRRVCRYKLDGKNRMWEEVFAVQQSPSNVISLQDLDVNRQGDVVVIHRGYLPHSIWKYTASSRKVEFVTRAGVLIYDLDLEAPLLSPDGRWVGFIRRGEFYLAHHKGGQP